MAFGSRRAGLLGLLILMLIAIAVAWDVSPRGHRAADAPADEFSAARAFDVIDEIAQRPRPVGTDEHARARELLVEKLRAIGLPTEVQRGVGRWPEQFASDQLSIANVANIVARLPGSDPTGTVYLTAHYDSVASGPGANDDTVGVASVLEAVRALREGPTPRNDVVVLLTDAEERGLLGAEAFVHDGGFGARPGVVVNLESRGANGPALLWRTTQPDAGLMRIVAGSAPHPAADSFATAFAASQTTSDTDFTAFEPAGVSVLDWAYIGGGAYYHNVLDDPARVNLATVQQMGDNTLALAAAFGDADLASLSDDAAAGYFALPGVLVVYPTVVGLVGAALMLAGVVLVVWWARRDHAVRLGQLAVAAGSALLATLVAVGVGYGLWQELTAIRPGYSAMVDTYRPALYYCAMVGAAVAVLLGWYAIARRWLGPGAALLGMLSLVAVCALLLTGAAPAAAHVLVVPVLGAVAGWLVVLRAAPRWRVVGLVVGLVPATVFLSGAVWPTIQLGVGTAAFAVVPMAFLLGGLLLPLVEAAWPRRRASLVPAVAATLVALLVAVGLAVDRFDATHPMPAHLAYALDADTGAAVWVSRRAPTRWTEQFVADSSPTGVSGEVWDDVVSSGPAPAESLPAPQLQVVSDTADFDGRVIRLQLRSERGATSLGLQFPDTELRTLTIAGREIIPVPAAGFRFHAPDPDGVEVELSAPAGPVTLRLVDFRWLPDSGLASYEPPPDDVYARQDCESAVLVTHTL